MWEMTVVNKQMGNLGKQGRKLIIMYGESDYP